MLDLKKRIVIVLLGLTLAVTMTACDSDDPSYTTPGGDSSTTAPVGS